MSTRVIKYIDHITFPEVVGELVRNAPGLEGVRYTADYPKEVGQVPAIVWKRVRRVPGVEGQETRAARFREERTYGQEQTIQIYSQWQAVLFQFDICALSSSEADSLLWRFESLMDESKGTFLTLGAQRVVHEEEVRDALLPRTDNMEVRSTRYLAILEKLNFLTVPEVQELHVRILHPQEEDVEVVTRGAGGYDELGTTFISDILYVSSASPSGIARSEDYVQNVDFSVIQDSGGTYRTRIYWIDAGRNPIPGETYYVRFRHWTGFSRLRV